MIRRRWLWLMGIIAGLVVVASTLGVFIDEPLRRYMERQVNSHVKGYTIRLGKLDLQLLRFSVDLYDLLILQDANPEPPLVHIPKLTSSLQWTALLAGSIVSDVLVERPQLHINLRQFRTEAMDEVPLKDRGWREAVQSVSPVKVNHLRVVDGEVTYVDENPSQPLRISQLNLRAENIRNIRSQEGVYPSPIHIDATIFETGRYSLTVRRIF